ncbi:MAG: Vitamin B12 transporter BtuB [Bacteroidetes bacterium ADurb.Bin408]|nr:MAG: Vitamin B12 transporter BtuB [Bacteroidetes bacterium ADurb.Bin408]
MKKFIWISLLAVAIPFLATAQCLIKGKVTDKDDGSPLPYAHITVENTLLIAFSNTEGVYKIQNLSEDTYLIKCTFVGYKPFSKEIEVRGTQELNIALEKSEVLADEVIIKATRTGEQTAVAHTNLSKQQVAQINLGQDLPVLLNTTPSVVMTSDAGAGVGYTGIKIRGSDGTRINVTINGIPVNDAESHGVWWVNMPDIVSSVENIQIQRGVGTSTNGAGAFGGTINMLTNTLNPESYAGLSASYGSFNTSKKTINFGSGLLNSKWVFDGRLSQIHSDGYIDRSKTDLSSYYLSGGYYGKKNIIKLIHFSGKEKTYQAWYGVPKDSLSTNRTFNPAGLYYDTNGHVQYYKNETDNYQQDHYQLHYALNINHNLTFNAAAHYTYGRGYYEQYREDDAFEDYSLPNPIIGSDTLTETDFIRRRWLDNRFYGTTYALSYNSFSKLSLIAGGGYNRYEGNHFGEIIWAGIAKDIPMGKRYYDNDALKTDLNNYIKLSYTFKQLNIFGDIQQRHITYSFLGKAIVDNAVEDMQQDVVFNFINPKAGINYDINGRNSVYCFWGKANREPVRDDFVASSASSRPRPETLNNFEVGYKRNTQKYNAGINTYLMNYKDQLVLTGEINDVGEYTRKNIENSYRCGIEAEAGIIFGKIARWNFNITYSQNRLKKFTEYYDVYDANWDWTGTDSVTYTNTHIAFSPEIIAGSVLNFTPLKNLSCDVISKYIGQQYIDNTSSKERMLEPYFINDLKLSYSFNKFKPTNFEFVILINNLLDVNYISNAWVYDAIVDNSAPKAVSDGYFPQAGRHYLAGINIKFK